MKHEYILEYLDKKELSFIQNKLLNISDFLRTSWIIKFEYKIIDERIK